MGLEVEQLSYYDYEAKGGIERRLGLWKEGKLQHHPVLRASALLS